MSDDEQLWTPPPNARRDDDSEAEPELFDTSRWHRDKHDATDEELANGLGIPLFRPPSDEWQCSYGCPGVDVLGRFEHSWNCPYWWNEGKNKTPF